MGQIRTLGEGDGAAMLERELRGLRVCQGRRGRACGHEQRTTTYLTG